MLGRKRDKDAALSRCAEPLRDSHGTGICRAHAHHHRNSGLLRRPSSICRHCRCVATMAHYTSGSPKTDLRTFQGLGRRR